MPKFLAKTVIYIKFVPWAICLYLSAVFHYTERLMVDTFFIRWHASIPFLSSGMLRYLFYPVACFDIITMQIIVIYYELSRIIDFTYFLFKLTIRKVGWNARNFNIISLVIYCKLTFSLSKSSILLFIFRRDSLKFSLSAYVIHFPL